MSRFVQSIEKLNKESGSAPSMGFGLVRKSGPAVRSSVMVVLAVLSDPSHAAAAAKHADGVLVRPVGKTGEANTNGLSEGTETTWGTQVGKLTAEHATALKKQGCDFVLLATAAVPLDALKDNEVGRILQVPADVDDDQTRVYSAMPIDAVLLAETLTSPFTLEQLIEIASMRAATTKPVLVQLAGNPSQWELECLRDIGISGVALVIEGSSLSALEAVSKTVRELGPRKPPKAERAMALMPSAGMAQTQPSREKPKKEDDDEDD